MKLQDLLGGAYHEGMTIDEIESALSDVKLPNDSSEIVKLKKAISNSNSEVAKYKELLKSKQTEEETRAQEIKETMERLERENKEWEKKFAVSENTKELMGIGYDAELASKTATAMFDGDMKSVIANHRSFIEAKEKAIRSELLSSTPYPTGSSVVNPMTREQILAIADTEERQAAIAEHRDLFE